MGRRKKHLNEFKAMVALETIKGHETLEQLTVKHGDSSNTENSLETKGGKEPCKGFVYLVAIIDWFSRKVVSWRLNTTLNNSFCIEALHEAIVKYGRPEIFNTDQGTEFKAASFIEILEDNRI